MNRTSRDAGRLNLQKDFEVADLTESSESCGSDSELIAGEASAFAAPHEPSAPTQRLQWLRLQIVELQRLAQHYKYLRGDRNGEASSVPTPRRRKSNDIIVPPDVGDDAFLNYSHDFKLRRLVAQRAKAARTAARATGHPISMTKRPGQGHWRQNFSGHNVVSSRKQSALFRPLSIRKSLKSNHLGRGVSNGGRGEAATPGRGSMKRNDFNINDMVLPFSWQNRHQVISEIKVKEITTPPFCRRVSDLPRSDPESWRERSFDSLQSKASTPEDIMVEDTSEEDTSDEAFASRHVIMELREIAKRMPLIEKKQREAEARRAAALVSYDEEFMSLNIDEATDNKKSTKKKELTAKDSFQSAMAADAEIPRLQVATN
mmetsp:Transcript_8926/g.20512  ORF Transcript_8926/g.20512 Transcript_8926/m.20512 type:complete len:374 (+) Transcript_8926:64-1185(+)